MILILGLLHVFYNFVIYRAILSKVLIKIKIFNKNPHLFFSVNPFLLFFLKILYFYIFLVYF